MKIEQKKELGDDLIRQLKRSIAWHWVLTGFWVVLVILLIIRFDLVNRWTFGIVGFTTVFFMVFHNMGNKQNCDLHEMINTMFCERDELIKELYKDK